VRADANAKVARSFAFEGGGGAEGAAARKQKHTRSVGITLK